MKAGHHERATYLFPVHLEQSKKKVLGKNSQGLFILNTLNMGIYKSTN